MLCVCGESDLVTGIESNIIEIPCLLPYGLIFIRRSYRGIGMVQDLVKTPFDMFNDYPVVATRFWEYLSLCWKCKTFWNELCQRSSDSWSMSHTVCECHVILHFLMFKSKRRRRIWYGPFLQWSGIYMGYKRSVRGVVKGCL